MYDYDRAARPKTAAHMDLHEAWHKIVDHHASAENRELFRLLQQTEDYLHSVGMTLVTGKSYLGKEYHGSDGLRLSGYLTVQELEENTTSSRDAQNAEKWVQTALGVHGSATLLKEGPEVNRSGEKVKTWGIDISES